MPFRPSRDITNRDLAAIANAEDSNDEDYNDREQRSRPKQKARPRRGGSALPRKKQQRGGYKGSDVSDDDDDEVTEDEVWTDEEEPEEPETNERGRPMRRAAKKLNTYEESDEEEKADLSESEDSDTPKTPRRRPRGAPVPAPVPAAATATESPRSKIVTLKIRTPLPPTRSLRERKSSISARPSSSSVPTGTRRSRRMSHENEDEDLVELSNSGRHAVRAGSREPGLPARASRGSKSIKYPSRSTIDEVDEPDSHPKENEEEQLEIKASQHEMHEEEVPASQAELPDIIPQLLSDLHTAADPEVVPPSEDPLHLSPEKEPTRPEIEALSDLAEEDEEDDDEGPVTSRARVTRGGGQKRKAESPPPDEPAAGGRRLRAKTSAARPISAPQSRRRGIDETSDFDPGGDAEEPEEMSDSAASGASPRKKSQRNNDDSQSSNGGRRSTRLRSRKAVSRPASGSEVEDIEYELAEELAELKKDGSKRKRPVREELIYETRGRRNAAPKNYDLMRNLPQIEEDDEAAAAPSPSQRARRIGAGWQHRTLLDTYGPFGGAGGRSLLGGPSRRADADSDSSDEETMKQPKPVGGMVGMTPTTATNPFNPFSAQPLNSDPAQQLAGTPANLGKVKDKQALADADPLGVDQNVDFDSVGGLQGHIDQLKEMVALPLLYPEIFMRFKITPPRGVLFHGPPGTGKTLLARALATSVSSQGRKVTFYMRKGADALSKWVGEAERQLRMLFDEARKTQPSIIFFDEIDGLAPVRSSKQEQIHASIVSTLLALMDGMDGRGQVIVIGATNRPDSIDPALRRPGRFDREFYFPLPDTEARRSIINIHTKAWNPPLDDGIKDELADMTKGYGGADLRALCTEAALNAVQRRYPQIYKSKEKLLIDPKTIEVMPKDFMISIKKMTPSSERSASSGAAPLPQSIAPLLDRPFGEIKDLIAEIMPQKKKTTALEEAMFEDAADGMGFGRERMQQAFESSRVFRPRLLIHGKIGMGQQYVAAALLNHFQGIHVQSFELSTLLSDTASTPEATIIRLFSEVKMHKPSVIYIPNVQEWYGTLNPQVLTTFFGLLRSIKPTDPILVLGFAEADADQEDVGMKRELFGYSQRNQYLLDSPQKQERNEFFQPLKGYIKTKPSDFPDPTKRKRRQMEILPPAPPDRPRTPPPPSKEELKAQKKKDRQTLNLLKIRLQPIMDQIRTRHKKFRTGVIEESAIRYLYDEADPGTVTSDVAGAFPIAQASFRPFEVGKDAHGVPGLIDQGSSKFYYNLDSVTIEKRLSNGYYKRPKDFVADIKRLAKDAKAIEDEDRLLKANELLANVEVDIAVIEMNEPGLSAECEKVYQRELKREKESRQKEAPAAGHTGAIMGPPRTAANGSDLAATTTTEGTGQIQLGEGFQNPKDTLGKIFPITPSRPPSNSSVMTNGYHPHPGNRDSNHTGSGHEADAEGDTPRHNSNVNSNSKTSAETQKTHTTTTTSSYDNRGSAQPRPYWMHTGPSQQLRREHGMQEKLSQSDYVTPMRTDSQAVDYHNEASTTQTTSGQKNSGPSDQQQNTQESGPNLFIYDERQSAGGTDIPDTQNTQENPPAQSSQSSTNGVSSHYVTARPDTSSQSNSQPNASAPPVPPFAPSIAAHQPATAPAAISRAATSGTNALSNLLNPPSPKSSLSSAPQDNLILPLESSIENTILDLADKTSGLSVEQLEQVNSVLMDVLWKTRGEWDRRKVLARLVESFNEVLADMKSVGQDFQPLSWEGLGTSTRRIEG
ncbi:TAT-binding protein-like protein 7, AAA ATPase [Exophiala xenobiotica]|uniref:TAT-binding protein-like protein 7, AAA ATPase n=1 Tax=Lithohypha guttulata TaxID=1690604 RepID=A0ABR0JZM8_9EURO|nr:TAT-binding protein-like protein 7, AAA ATPase [Lithohypha guttulata]KAK5311175.1 TAT-binding protein-like protein 7, AAA ATPase [Exophiala xenobiotica]